MTGIYKITCKNYYYIGSSINVKIRWRVHLNSLRKNKHHSVFMQNVFNKYGEENFSIKIILECDSQSLLNKENEFLKEHCLDDACMNTALNALAPMMGRKHSKETKAKMSIAQKGKSLTQSHKNKIGDSLRGKNSSSSKDVTLTHEDGRKLIFHRVREASKYFSCDHTTILRYIKLGRRPQGNSPLNGWLPTYS